MAIYACTEEVDMTQEALKLALEWFEKDGEPDHHPVVTAIKEALAQEQEPVGQVVNATDKAFECKFVKILPIGTKLYTTPPQRTEQERIGFAGVKIWFGDQQVVKLLTQTELHHADDPFGLVGHASEICLATLKEMNDD